MTTMTTEPNNNMKLTRQTITMSFVALLLTVSLYYNHTHLGNTVRYALGEDSSSHGKPSSSLLRGDSNVTTTSYRNLNNNNNNIQQPLPKMNLMYSVVGDSSLTIDELEVSLKSVLINAPLDAELKVHIVIDEHAHPAILHMLNKTGIERSMWRNQIHINLHVLTQDLIERFMNQVVTSMPRKNVTIDRSPGFYFRLFTNEILHETKDPVLYMDTDVIIMANLNPILDVMDPNYLFQMGIDNNICAGFIVVNPSRWHDFWNITQSLPAHRWWNVYGVNDQFILEMVKEYNRDMVKDLPKEWHVHLSNGFRHQAHRLLEDRPQFGFLHFSGMREESWRWWDGGGVWSYCEESEGCRDNATNQELFKQGFNLAEYYVYLPWTQVRYMGSNLAGRNGQPLVIRSRCVSDGTPCRLAQL